MTCGGPNDKTFYWPDFDASALVDDRVALRFGQGRVKVLRFDDVKTEDHLFGLDERPVSNPVGSYRRGDVVRLKGKGRDRGSLGDMNLMAVDGRRDAAVGFVSFSIFNAPSPNSKIGF